MLWATDYRNYDNFRERLKTVQKRLDCGGVNYHLPLPEGPEAQYVEFVDSVEVILSNSLGYEMFYEGGGSREQGVGN